MSMRRFAGCMLATLALAAVACAGPSAGSTPPPKEVEGRVGTSSGERVLIGLDGQALGDFHRAMRGGDDAGLATLIGQHRLLTVPSGTRVLVLATSGTDGPS